MNSLNSVYQFLWFLGKLYIIWFDIIHEIHEYTSFNGKIVTVSFTEELKFHHVHGQNAVIVNNGRTATRPNASGEFNDAIIMSNRPLKDNELFEIIIEKRVDRWSGSIEAGKIIIL
jgi:hypothetical protein